MEKYGLVLAGGGGKGAYQIGAWKALREMNLCFEAIIGVSIGSINGAFIAANDYDKAIDFWNNISIDKGIKISETLPNPENLLSKKNWSVLFREFIKFGGFDASPARDFVAEYIDEDKIRKSLIDFGVIAVQLSQSSNKFEFFLEDMPEGKVINYLLASANVPFANNIAPEGERYLDGGAYDNIPVNTLKKRGYNKLIVVDISHIKGVAHSIDTLNCQITYIRPYDMDDLGATFDFETATNEKRIQFGYYDTKKAFSLLSGNIYYFLPEVFRSAVKEYGVDTILRLEEFAHRLEVPKLEVYNFENFIYATKNAYNEYLFSKEQEESSQNENDTNLLRTIIKEQKDSEQSFLKNSLKRRFNIRNQIDEYTDVIALLNTFTDFSQ